MSIVYNKTPLLRQFFPGKSPAQFFLKYECLQPSGSFKSRGIGNLIMKSAIRIQKDGKKSPQIFASSGGNAGFAAATACQRLSLPCTVVVPTATKKRMVEKIRNTGAQVIVSGAYWKEADTFLKADVMQKIDTQVVEPIYVPVSYTHLDVYKRQTLDLDSGSDDDDNIVVDDRKLIKDEGALPISQLSKATILNLKARLSKQNQDISQRPLEGRDARLDHNKLFNTLRKASRKQILDHQREVIETKGFKLEDMVKEKELVENLLEQEIIRNKKIRQKEKRREKLENSEFKLSPHDSGSDSGSESSKFALSGNEVTDYELSGSEDEIREEPDNEEEEEEDDIVPKKKKAHHVKRMIDESDSENEAVPKEKVDASVPKRIAINLGHYGDNIEEEVNKFQETNDMNTQQTDKITMERNIVENKAILEDTAVVDEDNINEEADEAIRRELIDKEKLQLRQKELEKAIKLKELKHKGVTNFFEMEAEESDDEWHGIGGADGEGSDEYDSDVEKMIDDYSKNNFNSHEIREMLAAENKEMDVKMINKILYDIKNGGFRNKRAKNSLELELSDDEDDVLQQYRLKRRELMRKRRLEICLLYTSRCV